MVERYPGYDVMAKRHTLSWNDKTREVVDRRLAIPREPRFFTETDFATLVAIAARITPQPVDRPPNPVAALVEEKLLQQRRDGFRAPGMPQQGEAWRRGLLALDAEAQAAYGAPFRALAATTQDAVLSRMQAGDLHHASWGDMPPHTFFQQRLLPDIVHAYWSWPTAWSEVGWGGPASPRGYVRMGYDERDPWEAVEAKGDDAESVRRKNRHVR